MASAIHNGLTLIARNGAGSSDAYIYVQVTRGAEYGRNHAPLPDVPRTVFAFTAPWPTGRPGWLETGLPAVTAQDTRSAPGNGTPLFPSHSPMRPLGPILRTNGWKKLCQAARDAAKMVRRQSNA